MSPTTPADFSNPDQTNPDQTPGDSPNASEGPSASDHPAESDVPGKWTRAKSPLFRWFLGFVLAVWIWQELPREIGRWYYAAQRNCSLDRDYVQALTWIKRAMDWDAENAAYWLECGNTFMELQQYNESWLAFDRAGELLDPSAATADPFSVDTMAFAHALNGAAYARALANRELDRARQDVDQALTIFPSSSAIIDTRGYIYYLTGDYEQALIDTNRAVLTAAANYERDKRRLLRKRTKSVRRRQWDAQLRSLDEGLAELHEHRGWVYQKLGKVDSAQRDLKAAEMFKSRIAAD